MIIHHTPSYKIAAHRQAIVQEKSVYKAPRHFSRWSKVTDENLIEFLMHRESAHFAIVYHASGQNNARRAEVEAQYEEACRLELSLAGRGEFIRANFISLDKLNHMVEDKLQRKVA